MASPSENYIRAFTSEQTVVLTGSAAQQKQQIKSGQGRVQTEASRINRKELKEELAAQKLNARTAGITGPNPAAQVQKGAQTDANALGGGAVNTGERVNVIGDALGDAGAGIQRWASNLPTPGGIGILLLVIFIMMWAIIPVDKAGYTRMQLLWLTVTGRTHLHGSSVQYADQLSSGGGSTGNPVTLSSQVGTSQGSVFSTDVSIADFSTGNSLGF